MPEVLIGLSLDERAALYDMLKKGPASYKRNGSLIQRLCRRGLARSRRRPPTKARSAWYEITPAGRAALQSSAEPTDARSVISAETREAPTNPPDQKGNNQ